MSKLYKWDKKDLIKNLFLLNQETRKNILSNEEKIMQEFYIDAILDMLKIKPDSNEKYPYLFLINKILKKNIKDKVKNYSTEYQKDVIKTSVDIILPNKKISELDFFRLLEPRISLDEQIALIKDEFSKTPELKKAHDKLFNPNYHLLKISRLFGKDAFYSGKNNGYVSNKNNNTILSFASLCHEVGHYDEFVTTDGLIDKKINIHAQKTLNNYEEVYSIFYELISVLILYNNGYINDYEASLLLNYIKEENTYNIQYFLLAINYVCENKNVNINLIRLLHRKLTDLSMYYYSYIIAEKLFKEYLNDPKKAFYNLNYLIRNVSPYNEEKVLKYCDIDLYNASNKIISIKKSKR